LIRIEKDRADAALGSVDFGIGSNSDRYVIQNFDPTSSKKAGGQPPSSPGSSYAREESKLLDTESGGVSGAFGGIDGGSGRSSSGGVPAVGDG
jgi:hypothetical protein